MRRLIAAALALIMLAALCSCSLRYKKTMVLNSSGRTIMMMRES